MMVRAYTHLQDNNIGEAELKLSNATTLALSQCATHPAQCTSCCTVGTLTLLGQEDALKCLFTFLGAIVTPVMQTKSTLGMSAVTAFQWYAARWKWSSLSELNNRGAFRFTFLTSSQCPYGIMHIMVHVSSLSVSLFCLLLWR